MGPAAPRSSETIAATEALRAALGDEVDLLLDAHTMFAPAEAAYLGHALEPFRLYFYEDPIRPLNPLSLRLVREKVNLPIATGEQLAHKWEFQPLIENELVDYLRIDLVHAGGITEAKKILASGRDARAALGAASRELAGERGGVPARGHGGAELRDPGVDGARAAVRALPERPARVETATSTPPAGPGLGLELDEAEARRRPSRDAPLPSRSLARRRRRRLLRRKAASTSPASSIACSRHPGAYGDCCSW